MPRDPRYMTLAGSSKLMISCISGRFRGLQSTFLGFEAFLAVFVGYILGFWAREDFDAP